MVIVSCDVNKNSHLSCLYDTSKGYILHISMLSVFAGVDNGNSNSIDERLLLYVENEAELVV